MATLSSRPREVQDAVRPLWALMVSVSDNDFGGDGCGAGVTRAAYVALHVRVAKALQAGFLMGEASSVATRDWVRRGAAPNAWPAPPGTVCSNVVRDDIVLLIRTWCSLQ